MRQPNFRRRLPVLLAAAGATLAFACAPPPGQDPDEPDPTEPRDAPEVEVLASDLSRELDPEVSVDDLGALVAGNTDFAFELMREALRDPEHASDNLFFSPHSISMALAMTYAGALGTTAEEMAATLEFRLPPERLHAAFNALDLEIARRSEAGGGEDDGEPFELSVVNAIWGQRDYPFLTPFLDTLAVNYGAPMYVMDFKSDFEGARETINDWVAYHTNDRIDDLLPEGSLSNWTRLVLTNAIFFHAGWQDPFDPDQTEDADFFPAQGGTATVPMMRQWGEFAYAEVGGVQVVSLPYVGHEVEMLVLLPEAGGLEDLEARIDHALLDEMVGALETHMGPFSMPRFSFDTPLGLKDILESMGMEIPFDMFGADFHAMADIGATSDANLYISDVLHKAFVAVDEEGTEAAAATAVIVSGTDSAPEFPPFEMTVDRPFVFAIHDRPTGAVLFLGRVVDPS